MERLLAHPATLPLVHVDHSHRTSTARTGQCVRVHGVVVTAKYFLEVQSKNGKLYRNADDYKLTELDCETFRPRVSEDDAKRIVQDLLKVAKREVEYDANGTATISTAPPKGESVKIGHVQGDGTMWGKSKSEEDAAAAVVAFLSAYYASANGPTFRIVYSAQA